jgi:cell division protein FtsZ
MKYMEDLIPLDLPIVDSSIIKVIGVGGGGGNAVNHMYNKGIRDVSFVVCNTDNQALNHSPVPLKIQLGRNTTSGLGAGGNPDVARQAAEESIDRIQDMLKDNTKMVFITAGMGGGTGTGASPVVAKAAHDLGILTVGIVTIPFAFEGKMKIRQALEGVAALSEHVDALLVINNEKLREIFSDLELSNAFAKADDVLTNAAKGIAEIITVPGYINTDFADVYTILSHGNIAIMNTGYASGEHRITKAITDALNSPLLNTNNVHGASKVLLSLYCSMDNQIRMEEVKEINEFMANIGDDITVIWGATFDDTLGDQVKITLIATGYDVSDIPGMPASAKKKLHDMKKEPVHTVSFEDEEEEIIIDTLPKMEELSFDLKIDKTIETYYPETKTVQAQPEPEQDLFNDSESSNNFETFTLDDIEDEDQIKQAEEIPAWKRNLLRRN